MAWIESHQGTDRHPKTRKLCRLLGISRPAAVGHLHMFWWWAMDYAQDGDISKFGPDDIADAVDWEGDADQFYDALLASGFVDETEAGRKIHGWYGYAGRLIERRVADAERKRISRGRKKPKQSDSEDSPQDVRGTGEGRRSESIRDLNPNLNLNQNIKEKDICPEPPPAAQDPSPPPDEMEKPEKGKKEPKYDTDNTYYKMAVYFKGKIDIMAAQEGLQHLTSKTNLQKWADDFRKLVELNKQSDKDLIRSVMDWVVTDEFWRSNILSADKFRDKFPKLVMDMRKANRPAKSTGGSSKPILPIVQHTGEGSEVSEQEMEELLQLAEQMSGKR
ncbi:hypothetical protein [Paenibacillus medicaginis]|uniref:Uncharacterized protein n=1 Tax=Paenibacillus medicaginis TaxID=1470560 RepID=A0ABV5C0L6_9BACL